MGTLSGDCRFSGVPGIRTGSSQGDLNDEEAPVVACDYFGGVYEYIKQMLMEEDDLEHRPCMFQDCSALQAAEKYFYDALSDKCSAPLNSSMNPQVFAVNNQAVVSSDLSRSASGFAPWSVLHSHGEGVFVGGPSAFSCHYDGLEDAAERCFQVLNSGAGTRPSQETYRPSGLMNVEPTEMNVRVLKGEGRGGQGNFPDRDSRSKKARDRVDQGDCEQERSSKQLAGYAEDSVQMENFDKSLLCQKMNPGFYETPAEESSSDSDENMKQYRKTTEVKRGRPKGSKKNRKVKEVVDLSSLLTRCAEAVSGFNNKTGEELLRQIRQHSSPYGDANERLAHYFANALEARMTGTGSALYTAFALRRIPAIELLKSYQTYVTGCPFKRMSNIFANKSIARCAREATRIHIIDFGILYGFQWPCIIQGLSLMPGGAPRLRITGIDFPQPGFKPEERVDQTGRRLMNYCERFNVPFQYNAIAKRWDDISIEDLKIERDEMLVVNCLYRLRHVPDESAGVNSPRDAVLKFIKKLNPDLFVHGIVNGTYNAPFFATRFREALYHYTSLFDMMEATIPREDPDRLLYEREMFGRDVMNVVACEGSERIERPETYKQWQVRNQRAGFRQLPLNKEIMKEIKTKVKRDYHNDFLLDEDSNWMLQGWRGRVMYALSCWKPSQNRTD
ncbi:Scarecrow-like protein 14 [Sesamum alatum]|uniref:Scarecrow-like protein 14 n=1 Tax=Sesamum alatum TaxID=300844 RepID=A0AAE1Z321_9LAMI|nr:Scarecrow-like protein 14 [Sesamum alatum]